MVMLKKKSLTGLEFCISNFFNSLFKLVETQPPCN